MTSPVVGEAAQPPSGNLRVLVTGGSSGLGAALVAAHLARGDQVLNCDLNEPAAAPDGGFETGLDGPPQPSSAEGRPAMVEEVAQRPSRNLPRPPSAAYRRLDVRSDDDWAAARAWVEHEWGGLDMLYNNAGVAGGGRIDVATMDEWEWITSINLFGVVRGVRTFVPMMKAQRSGRIVNVASLAGLVHPAGMASYNAVKAAVVALTQTLGHELAEYDVTAHVVCPSYFRTGLVESMQGRDTAVGAVIGQLVADAPLGAAEIAAAVLEALDRGEELILPDDAARAAYALKVTDRAAYDEVMRKQAARLNALGQAR